MAHLAVDNGAAPRAEELTRIVLRPLATPLPLGVLALALGSALLSSLQLSWIAASNTPQVALVVLVLVVPLELIAALFGFFIRDVVMATGFSLLTGSWAALGALLLSASPGMRSPVAGVLTIAIGVTLLVPAAAASLSKPAAAAIMTLSAIRLALTGVYQLGGPNGWQTAGGVLGVVLLCVAFYAALAFALEDVRHHAVLPVSRATTSAAAMSGDLGDQLGDVASEAGVRQES